jgi:ferredoxin
MKRVTIDADTCIGCGACATVTVNIQMKEVNGSMKAVVKKADIKDDEIDEHKEAADICPVDAIKIE